MVVCTSAMSFAIASTKYPFRLTKSMLLSGEFFHCHFSDFCEPVVIAFDADTVFCAPLAVALAALAALVDDIKPVLDTKLSVWC